MAFKDNLQIISAFRNKKQQDIANGTGISKQNISNWMNGLNEPGTENLDLIAKFLDTPREVFYMKSLTQDDLKRMFSKSDNTSVQQPGDNKQNGMTAKETFYTDLIENNEEYSLLPRAVLRDYKIVPDKIIDVIIKSGENERTALQRSMDLEIESLNEKNRTIIEGYKNGIKILELENERLKQENEQLRRQIPPKNED